MNIHFLYVLTFANSLSVWASQIVASLYALNLEASPLQVGTIAATFAIVPMLFAVASGKLVDRFGARWPMTFGATAGGIGMTLPYFFPGMLTLHVAGIMTGISIIFFNLAIQNLVGLVSTPENRARNFANYMLVNTTATLVAPIAGGFMIDHVGHGITCLSIASLSLIPIALLLVRGKALPGGTRKDSKASGGGVRAMLADKTIRQTLATGMLINAGINMYLVYMPVYAHAIGLSASTIGIVLAMNSSAAFVSRFMLPHSIKRFGEARVLAAAFFIGAVGLALIPLFHIAVVLGVISFAFGLGMGCGQPIVIMQMFSNSRDGRSGEALGLKFTTNQFTKLASPLLFGSIASAFGLLPMFWINAALMTLGGIVSRPKATQG